MSKGMYSKKPARIVRANPSGGGDRFWWGVFVGFVVIPVAVTAVVGFPRY